jgi:tRNA pseudouridine55 synthase
MGRRKNCRKVNGILLLNKPLGLTSNEALQQVKAIFGACKAGHTGSLDPLASGLLPVCFGMATKVSPFLLDSDKRYQVKVCLGVTTTTGDREGEVVETQSADAVTEQAVRDILPRFRGEIRQLPPMYSALKHKGERLYKLARKGIEVEREPRIVRIHSLTLDGCDLPEFELNVRCSKGTYVRTLAEDIGKALGCGGHVAALCRTRVGPYSMEQAVDMDTLKRISESEGRTGLDRLLLPVDSAIQAWPDIHLSGDAAYYLRMGQAVLVPKAPTQGWVRLYSSGDEFIGIGRIQEDGRVAPKRLLDAG